MTKYKEYLRAKGIMLECDYDVLPVYETGLETVITEVGDRGIGITWFYVSDFTQSLILRTGEIIEPKTPFDF